MITVYLKDHIGSLKAFLLTAENQHLLQEALWIDLVSPVKGEEALLEEALKLDIPTRDEMLMCDN